jgi:transposase
MSHADPTAVQPPVTAEDLPDDPDTLKRMILELLETMQERDRDILGLRHRLELLLRRLYGPKGERFDPNQGLLFPDAQTEQDKATADPPAPMAQAKPKRRCRPHGRRRLPEHLPRVPRHHVLSEAERICSTCGHLREEIGLDKSEQLDYKPASLFVIEHFVHKYACPCCSKRQQQRLLQESEAPPAPQPMQTPPPPPEPVPPPSEPVRVQEPRTTPVEPSSGCPPHALAQPICVPGMTTPVEPSSDTPTTGQPAQTLAVSPPSREPAAIVIAAPKPAMPIAKGLPGPGLLAHLIVSKYTDYLPLYRLENIYERQGLFLSRSTLCDWMMGCGQLLRPLYDRMVHWTLQSAALHTDDTPVKMQELKTHLLSTARLWGYLGDAAHPCNVFDFTLTRRRDGPQQFLANYQGYLHADAFSGYDGLYLPDPRTTLARIIEVACNAHARRKFYEARTSDSLRSHQALAYYRQLYELERQAKDFSESQRLQMRQDLSLPILKAFHPWIEKEYKEVLPKSPMAEALGYALNHWTALIRYTEAGFLAIDNNVVEREMKRIAIGRKNWLFVGSPQGGQTAAVLMSFTSTCNRLEIEPWSYLQDVLTRLPNTLAGQLDDLLPDRWQAAQRARLAAPSPAVPPETPIPSPQSDP